MLNECSSLSLGGRQIPGYNARTVVYEVKLRS